MGEGTTERKAGKSDAEEFTVWGPSYLTHVDWKSPDHRRIVAASLVKGVSVMERDLQSTAEGKGHGHQAQPFLWWNFFNFQLIRQLIDEKDSSIFGAIFQYKSPVSNNDAPRYVIAFRGTLWKRKTWLTDVELDLKVPFNQLQESARFQLAMAAVTSIVSEGVSNIWLAGHSLGSAIGLLVGKNMMMMGFPPIESYLFNPPYISFPTEQCINNRILKHGLRIGKSLSKAAAATLMSQNNDSFRLLSEWFPNLFVNQSDYICSEYIAYFENRKKMEKLGLTRIERRASQHSTVSLLAGVFGKNAEPPLHLLPSAYLTVNLSWSDPHFKWAHGLRQWWDQHFTSAHGLRQWWDPNFHGQTEPHSLS